LNAKQIIEELNIDPGNYWATKEHWERYKKELAEYHIVIDYKWLKRL
jgi:hypothetical protein